MSQNKKTFATPKVRKFARELGANIDQIKGTERKGRITHSAKIKELTAKKEKNINREILIAVQQL